jgi:hypothetical protein
MTQQPTPNDITRRAATGDEDDGEARVPTPAHRGWREGRHAGLVAAAAGALWSMIVDLAVGRPFETWIFLGADVLNVFHVTAPPAVDALAFLVFVALVFMVLGRIGVVVAHRGTVQPYLIIVAAVILTLITLALIILTTAFTTSRLRHEAWPQILGSPLIALWTLALRLYRTHPSLNAALKQAADS